MAYQHMRRNWVLNIKKYISREHGSLQIKVATLEIMKTGYEDFLIIDDILFRIKIPKDETYSLQHI